MPHLTPAPHPLHTPCFSLHEHDHHDLGHHLHGDDGDGVHDRGRVPDMLHAPHGACKSLVWLWLLPAVGQVAPWRLDQAMAGRPQHQVCPEHHLNTPHMRI